MDDKEKRRSTDPTVVLVAGKIGSGKSTALNSIFGLNLEARSSPSSVTQVVHKEAVKKNGRSFCVVDSPGLGGVGRSTKSVVEQMAAAVKGSDFVLVYCLPVKPSDTLTETDKSIIMTMKSHFGSGLWDKCVLLLTFSDIARRHFKNDSDTNSYISYLEGHIQAFYHILKSCGAKLSEIKLVFKVDRPELEPLQEYCSGEIIAVPMMNAKSSTGVTISFSCTELAFDEILKMSQLARREEEGCCKALRRCSRFTYQLVWNPRPHLREAAAAVQHCFKNPRRSMTLMVQSGARHPCRVAVGAMVGAGVGCFCGACGYLWFILVSCLGALIAAVVALARMAKKEH